MNLYKFSSLKKQSASNLVHNCRRNVPSNLIQSRWDKDIHSWNWYIKKIIKKRPTYSQFLIKSKTANPGMRIYLHFF
jgi:hypothetical protein